MNQQIPLFGSSAKTLILLNAQFNESLLRNLSKLCSRIICADGGANSLLKMHGQQIIPDLIVGDFDSIDTETQKHYKSVGVEIKHDENQDNTDLEKCLDLCLTDEILVLGRFSGRLDHTLSMISTLHKYQSKFPSKKYTFFGDQSVLRILFPGSYNIEINQNYEQDQGCGLIPSGCYQASVYTTGFRWNLDFENPIIFGSFISTSNQLASASITIETKDPIIFITQLVKDLQIQ